MSRLIPAPVNFIVASLCDNDYGRLLKSALEEGVNNYGYDVTLCPLLWKKYLIAYVLGDSLKSRVDLSTSGEFNYDGIRSTEAYLRENLRVSFERFAPTANDGGGSAFIDLASRKAWSY